MKLTSLAAVLLATATIVTCAQANGNIRLNGGVIAAGTSLAIDLSTLPSSIRYSVSCNINDANNATNPIVVSANIYCFNAMNTTLTLGSHSGVNAVQGILRATNTPFVIEPINSTCLVDEASQAVTITNTDQSGDYISVDNCIAKPMTSNSK